MLLSLRFNSVSADTLVESAAGDSAAAKAAAPAGPKEQLERFRAITVVGPLARSAAATAAAPSSPRARPLSCTRPAPVADRSATNAATAPGSGPARCRLVLR